MSQVASASSFNSIKAERANVFVARILLAEASQSCSCGYLVFFVACVIFFVFGQHHIVREHPFPCIKRYELIFTVPKNSSMDGWVGGWGTTLCRITRLCFVSFINKHYMILHYYAVLICRGDVTCRPLEPIQTPQMKQLATHQLLAISFEQRGSKNAQLNQVVF